MQVKGNILVIFYNFSNKQDTYLSFTISKIMPEYRTYLENGFT